MITETFVFRVRRLVAGWCDIVMYVNNKRIYFVASYIGINPLASMVDACAKLMDDSSDKYTLVWQSEPGTLRIEMEGKSKNQLQLDITKVDEGKEWHETVPENDDNKQDFLGLHSGTKGCRSESPNGEITFVDIKSGFVTSPQK